MIKKYLFFFVVTALLLSSCKSQYGSQSDYSVIDGRIYHKNGEELTADFSFLTESVCEVGDRTQAFGGPRVYEDKYLISDQLYCLCGADCSSWDIYIFDLETKNYMSHRQIISGIFKEDPDIGEAIAKCNKNIQVEDCTLHHIKEIKGDDLIVDIFEDDPNLEDEAIFPCSMWIPNDLKYSRDEVENICGMKWLKELKLKNLNEQINGNKTRFSDEEKVKLIEGLFPILEKNEVSYFSMNRCLSVNYKSGEYAEEACGDTYATEKKPFDEESKKFFNNLRTQLMELDIFWIYNAKYEDGRLTYAEFNFHSPNGFDRYRYIYEPEHKVKEPTRPQCSGEYWDKPINENWYFQCEDWN